MVAVEPCLFVVLAANERAMNSTSRSCRTKKTYTLLFDGSSRESHPFVNQLPASALEAWEVRSCGRPALVAVFLLLLGVCQLVRTTVQRKKNKSTLGNSTPMHFYGRCITIDGTAVWLLLKVYELVGPT